MAIAIANGELVDVGDWLEDRSGRMVSRIQGINYDDGTMSMRRWNKPKGRWRPPFGGGRPFTLTLKYFSSDANGWTPMKGGK
jgi:hypothetical protein